MNEAVCKIGGATLGTLTYVALSVAAFAFLKWVGVPRLPLWAGVILVPLGAWGGVTILRDSSRYFTGKCRRYWGHA